jgi:hypothetical protein
MGINEKASDVALEWVKQIITLSSGIVALSATFLTRITSFSSWILIILILSWGCFIASILTGLETISIIVKSHLDGNNNWNEDEGKAYAKACKYLFVSGIIVFCIFAIFTIVFNK